MSNHLHPNELLALLDGELPADQHLLACAVCRGQSEAMRSGITDYLAYHQRVLVPFAPPPPAAWKDLDGGMDAVDARLVARRRVAQVRRPRVWWALAAVAAAAVLVLAYAGYHRIPSVQAAELLRKAATAAPPVRPDTPIRFHTRTRDFVRPAVLLVTAPPQESELPRLFAAAHFDWKQPFSARAFADWRRRLADKRDQVECRGALCLIGTSSASNPLARATLVLRSTDLAPVRETLEFRQNETVEISPAYAPAESPESAVPSVAPAPRHTASPAPSLPPAALMLHALDALHAIGADLGDLELREEGQRLLVQGTGLSAARRDEIRRAVARIDGVDVELAGDSGGRTGAPPTRQQNQKPAGPAPLRTLLESKLHQGESIENVVDHILDASDSVMAQAFALRSLARRYSPPDEQALAASDRDLLARLRQDHARELNARFNQLAGMLAPLLSPAPAASASAAAWQRDAEQAFASVQALDSLLSATLAGPPRGSPSNTELLQQLEDALRRAQAAVRAIE